jgi:hypothetical protein
MTSNFEALNPTNTRYAESLGKGWSGVTGTNVSCVLQSQSLVDGRSVENACRNRHNYRFEMDPLAGKAVVSFSHEIAHAFVYRTSGGLSGSPPPERRPFTDEERRVMSPAAVRSMADLELAWKPVLPVAVHDTEYLREGEPIPRDLEATNLSVTIEVLLDGTAGDIRLYYPMSMVEPVLDPDRVDNLWQDMKERILADRPNWDVDLPAETFSQELDRLRQVLRVVHTATDRYWLCGGLAVDLLTGRGVRPHRDVDIFAEADAFASISEAMEKHGWSHDRDWRVENATTFANDEVSVDVCLVDVSTDGKVKILGGRQGGEWPGGMLDRHAIPFDGGVCQTLTAENLVRMKTTAIEHLMWRMYRIKDIVDLERLRQIIDGEREPLPIE